MGGGGGGTGTTKAEKKGFELGHWSATVWTTLLFQVNEF